jgi:hypothetical protein
MVLSILVDTQLHILAERLIELVFVLCNLTNEVHALLDMFLWMTFRRVSWQMLRGIRVDNTLDKVEVLVNGVLAVVHDEHVAYIKLMFLSFFFDSKRLKGGLMCTCQIHTNLVTKK